MNRCPLPIFGKKRQRQAVSASPSQIFAETDNENYGANMEGTNFDQNFGNTSVLQHPNNMQTPTRAGNSTSSGASPYRGSFSTNFGNTSTLQPSNNTQTSTQGRNSTNSVASPYRASFSTSSFKPAYPNASPSRPPPVRQPPPVHHPSPRSAPGFLRVSRPGAPQTNYQSRPSRPSGNVAQARYPPNQHMTRAPSMPPGSSPYTIRNSNVGNRPAANYQQNWNPVGPPLQRPIAPAPRPPYQPASGGTSWLTRSPQIRNQLPRNPPPPPPRSTYQQVGTGSAWSVEPHKQGVGSGYQSQHPNQNIQRPNPGVAARPVNEATDDSIKILTLSTREVKDVGAQLRRHQILYEVIGKLDSAVSLPDGGGASKFKISDGGESLLCVFYQIDRALPRLARGQTYRVVGKFNAAKSEMHCLSVRPASEEELQSFKRVASHCQKSLQSWNIPEF